MISILKRNKKKQLYYIVDGVDWAINEVEKIISIKLKTNHSISMRALVSAKGLRNSIVHFGSRGTMLVSENQKYINKSNTNILTWYHFDEQGKDKEYVNESLKILNMINLVHTTTEVTKMKLIQNGIPEEKVVVIPLGVDTEIFNQPDRDEYVRLRQKYQIPLNTFVIGSFQKDGQGWEEGMEPKLEKGPDIFCDVLEKVSKKHKIFVLLSGPARGYIKKRLDDAGINYYHKFFQDPNDVAELYKTIDLYLVASRSEGGPMSILQSLASGVPLVSTKVGMAPDVLQDGEYGLLSDVGDTDGLVKNVTKMIETEKIRKVFVERGLERVKIYSWDHIVKRMYNELYSKYL